ncbi:MAG: gamma carbonic anhydrase family protein [Flavobacteriales bacterium]|nr:gamma carbonic anhydrase family protein [Flavobacteriales bacterium]
MALIIPCRGKKPKIGLRSFLASNSTLVGDLKMGDDCSVWFNAVVRADVNSILIGDRVNIQDGAIIHCTYQTASTKIGNDVSIGHNAIVHGCEIHDRVLIGMGSIIMDRAIIETGSIVAAGAVVLEGTRVESGSLYAGVPARKVKDVDPDLSKGQIERIAKNYLKYSSWFSNEKEGV